jgi:hypothetical protein
MKRSNSWLTDWLIGSTFSRIPFCFPLMAFTGIALKPMRQDEVATIQ